LRQNLVITAAISAAQKIADNEESNVIEIWKRLKTSRRALSGRSVKKEVTKNADQDAVCPHTTFRSSPGPFRLRFGRKVADAVADATREYSTAIPWVDGV
jgi:hypothetical protein